MNEALEKFNEQLQRKSWTEWYCNLPAVRAVVQALPVIGGPLDTMHAMPGQLFQQERVELLFRFIGEALSHFDQDFLKKEWVNSDEFRDILVQAIESSARSRSEEKIRINALKVVPVATSKAGLKHKLAKLDNLCFKSHNLDIYMGLGRAIWINYRLKQQHEERNRF